MGSKEFKVGVKEGGGPPPGYRWNVSVVNRAFEEAMTFLNEDQYEHLASQVRELASQEEPTQSDTVDVRSVEDFYEIRDKGGILGKINVRVFFFVHKSSRTIVILGVIKKENNDQTPRHVVMQVQRRKRLFLEFHIQASS